MANSTTHWSAQEEGAIRKQLSIVLASAFFVRAERLGRFLKLYLATKGYSPLPAALMTRILGCDMIVLPG